MFQVLSFKSPPNTRNESVDVEVTSPMEFGRFLYSGISSNNLESHCHASVSLGYLGSIELFGDLTDSALSKAILFTFSRKKIQENITLKVYNSGMAIHSRSGPTLAVYPSSSLLICAYFGIQVRHLILVVLHREDQVLKCMTHLLLDEYNPCDPTPIVNSPVFGTISSLFSHSDANTAKTAKFLKKMGFILSDSSQTSSFGGSFNSLAAPVQSTPHPVPKTSSISPISDFLGRITNSMMHSSFKKFPVIRNHVAEKGVKLLDFKTKNSVWSYPSESLTQEDSQAEDKFPDLRRVLEDPAMFKLFKEFSVSEFSQENVKFWKKVEKYRKITNSEKLQFEAISIYRNFIVSGCQYDLNLLPQTTKGIHRRICNATPDIFDDAQKEIYTLMNDDTFERFQQSSYAASILSIQRKKHKFQTITMKKGFRLKPSLKFSNSPLNLSGCNSLPRSFK